LTKREATHERIKTQAGGNGASLKTLRMARGGKLPEQKGIEKNGKSELSSTARLHRLEGATKTFALTRHHLKILVSKKTVGKTLRRKIGRTGKKKRRGRVYKSWSTNTNYYWDDAKAGGKIMIKTGARPNPKHVSTQEGRGDPKRSR